MPALAIIGLGLALALNRTTRTAAFLRGVFFSSSVLSVTIVTLLWKVVFAPDGGFLANLFQAFGKAPVAFLSDANLALAGHRGHHDLVVYRSADDAVPGGAPAGAARVVRSRGARQRRPMEDAVERHAAVDPTHVRARDHH